MGFGRKVLTVEELCEHLRIHRVTLYRLLRRGEIPGFKIGAIGGSTSRISNAGNEALRRARRNQDDRRRLRQPSFRQGSRKARDRGKERSRQHASPGDCHRARFVGRCVFSRPIDRWQFRWRHLVRTPAKRSRHMRPSPLLEAIFRPGQWPPKYRLRERRK